MEVLPCKSVYYYYFWESIYKRNNANNANRVDIIKILINFVFAVEENKHMFEVIGVKKMISTIAIGFETLNERWSLSSFDGRTASKFFDAKKICKATTWIILICQREQNYWFVKVYVLIVRVYGSFAKNTGTGNEYILFSLLMVS